LADLPGYMVNYGLGAILTAEMRQHISEALGAFDTGDSRWYGWLSEHLLRYGSERDTRTLMQEFLGRQVSPQALLEQMHRLKPVSLQATGDHSADSTGQLQVGFASVDNDQRHALGRVVGVQFASRRPKTWIWQSTRPNPISQRHTGVRPADRFLLRFPW
jgi:hypothetical protein